MRAAAITTAADMGKTSAPRHGFLRRVSAFVAVCVLLRLSSTLWSSRSTGLPARKHQPAVAFTLPANPEPVHHVFDKINFNNTPTSDLRPQGQFQIAGRDASAPVISILTCTQDPRDTIWRTWQSIQQSSLQAFRWVIVNDHTTTPESLARLEQLAALDPRVVIVPNPGNPGLAIAKNVALNYVREHFTPYFTFIDDDDVIEFTIYEKAVWMLESNPTWALGSYYFTKYGAFNMLETRGMHLGATNYFFENFVVNGVVVRTANTTGVSFDETFVSGAEDWDFWLSMAEAGQWGGTLPEIGFWYWQNEEKFRKARWGKTLFGHSLANTRKRIREKHVGLEKHFPSLPVAPAAGLELAKWNSDVGNNICLPDAVMVVLPSFVDTPANQHLLRVVETLARSGRRVTVVATSYDPDTGLALRPLFLQYTSDVHVLPSFLRHVDQPRYIKYLTESRCIQDMLISNSKYIYELLPAISDQMPRMRVVDIIDEAGLTSKADTDLLQHSLIAQPWLWRTLVTRPSTKEKAIASGIDEQRIGLLDVASVAASEPVNIICEMQEGRAPRKQVNWTALSSYALHHAVTKDADTVDFAASQARIVPPRREGRGGELQKRCGEASKGDTEWISSIVDFSGCGGDSNGIDAEGLFQSTRYQCTQWCVWDLRTREKKGWSFDGRCWHNIGDGHWCLPMFMYRPTLDLPPAKVSKASGH